MPLPNIDVYLGAAQLPGSTPLESAIARAWLKEHQAEYDRVEFNVRLGEGVVLPPGSPDYMQKFVRASTTKRADMILYNGNVATIVEVKIRIGGSAVGQLLLYKKLLLAAHPEIADVKLIAAGSTIEQDVRDFYTGHDITVEIFPLAAPVS